MDKHIANVLWPCQEKQCWRCCDPVKIPFRRGASLFGFDIPKDKEWNPIRIPLHEIRAPENNIDTVRLAIFQCLFYDKESKLCTSYEKRPDICRNTSCIDTCSRKSIEDQHKEIIKTSFIKMKK